jgi:flagellum-specific ATP synthase
MKQTSLAMRADACRAGLRGLAATRIAGRVADIAGLVLNVDGLAGLAAVGDWVRVQERRAGGTGVVGEIVAFRNGLAQAMLFGPLDGIGPGDMVHLAPRPRSAPGSAAACLGRVLDPLGQPLDRKGPLWGAAAGWHSTNLSPVATGRARLGPPVELGVRALDLFTTCRQGQRLGLFAGSGVGKSTLLAMMARHTACDVRVLALVGERGREVREFIEDELGPEGLARSVVVVATSDAPPLMRRQAAYTAMSIAEALRDESRSVLLMMDSVTRFCLALREIGLSAGEPPATRGYPPSVFAELPRLLERAGPGPELPDRPAGHITALFTVLVEGDDTNEPVADAVRGFLDGHVMLDRRIAERGRFPAVDVLRSLSRAAAAVLSEEDSALLRRARGVLALYDDMADMIRLGAYRAGSDPLIDEAIVLAPRIEAVLRQQRDDHTGMPIAFEMLREALNPEATRR